MANKPDQASRLQFSNYAEIELRKELGAIARSKCDSYLAAFSACAKENGLMVVINCRAQNKASEFAREALPIGILRVRARSDRIVR
jgi:hypothetical protein